MLESSGVLSISAIGQGHEVQHDLMVTMYAGLKVIKRALSQDARRAWLLGKLPTAS